VVLTSFIKERFVRMGVPENKVVVLADCADLSQFVGLPGKQECRRRLGLPQDRTIIGYIGRFLTLGMEKGIPELVQAVADLPLVNGKEPLLACVGGPMDVVPSYLNLARCYGAPESRLRFVDRVPNREVPLWIKSFDIAVAPFPNSEHYAYYMSPLKLFEYMAGGVPILTTDLPSIREVLQHGETAWLVKPGNPADLAAGIKHLLTETCLKNTLSSAARKAVTKHTWEQRACTILKEAGVPRGTGTVPIAFD
jgi:glycosyltransferase involved in cell wall biosynthesis